MKNNGIQFFEVPNSFSELATIEPIKKVIPSRMIIDVHRNICMIGDKQSIKSKSLNEKMNLLTSQPEILTCIPERALTESSLTHHESLGAIVHILSHPELDGKTLVEFWTQE